MAITNSHPRIHTTGPIHHVVEIPADPGDGTPALVQYYLGTCETKPVVNIQKMKKPVFNDLGGRMVPFQKLQQGEVAQIGLLLNRFSQTAYQALLSLPQGNWQSETPGFESRYHRGQLTFDLHTFKLYQIWDFYGQTFPGADQLPAGYIWYNCELLKHEIADSGTVEEKLLLQIESTPRWNTSSLGFDLYSQDSATLAALQALIPAAAVAV